MVPMTKPNRATAKSERAPKPRTIDPGTHRAAAVEFLANPQESYTKDEVSAITGHRIDITDVREGALVAVTGARGPKRYTATSLRRALAKCGIGSEHDALVTAIASDDVEQVTVSTEALRRLIRGLFQEHERSHCAHEFYKPASHLPPRCRYCDKFEARPETFPRHEHATITVTNWPHGNGERRFCVDCFEASAPHPGIARNPQPLPPEEAKTAALRAMNAAWGTISELIDMATRRYGTR
jgi:hypothetical protein